MRFSKLQFALVSTMALIGLASCGGGGGSGSNPAPAPGPVVATGIDRGGISIGTIDRFSSIYVNGIRFDTSNAIIIINGLPASESDLSVGQVVLVEGTINSDGINGNADRVTLDENVKGPVTTGSIDLANQTFVVLGQTVLVTLDTVFDDDFSPQSLAALSDGDFVEVSGLVTENGEIAATFIDDDDGSEFEVHGPVSNLDTMIDQFEINGLVVDYSGAVLDDFPNGVISNGDQVEAKGVSVGSNGELTATKVELETLDFDDGDVGEIEGIVADFVSPADFTLNGIPVTTNAATVFEDGTVASLANGVHIEAEGSFNAAGTLVATKVDFEEVARIEIVSTVDSVSPGSNSLTIMGIQVQVDANTQIEDDSSLKMEPFTLNDISSGDWLEIRGVETGVGSGVVLATRVERDEAESEVELRGTVSSVNAQELTILGVTIQTDSNTEYRDVDDSPLLASEFFALVSAGTEVKADGVLVAPAQILADELELEN